MKTCICPKCKCDLSAEASKKCAESTLLPTLYLVSSTTKPTTVVVFCENGHDAIAVECECS
jgi:hypothetical protein